MKTISEKIMNQQNTAQNILGRNAPMFMPANMEQPMATKKSQTQKKQEEVSLFDVKELYDLAYAEKESGKDASFKKILAEAVKLDLAYRRQLTKAMAYKDHSKVKKFKTATEGVRAAS